MRNIHPDLNTSEFSSVADRSKQRQMLPGFWLIAGGLIFYELFIAVVPSYWGNLSATFITIAALIPAYLWCSGYAFGSPIFPLLGLTFIWTYALPLVSSDSRAVLRYTADAHWLASLNVSGFLLLSTFVWFQFVKKQPPLPPTYRCLEEGKGESLFLVGLGIGVIFDIYKVAGWLNLDGGTFALIRGSILGISALAVFVLAYRLGAKELSRSQSQWFVFLVITSMVVNSTGLVLVTAVSMFVIAATAFTIGSKKIPLSTIAIILILMTFFHYGKGSMRNKYWFSKGATSIVQPWEYPAWYTEWAGHSIEYLTGKTVSPIFEYKKKESLFERSSVVHIFLMAQTKSPQNVSYLNGATYAIIPQLLIPRIFDSNKIASHEGTYLLNIHYGLQSRKDTYRTTVGWGLLAEAYANFGQLGCAGLAVVLGMIYGQTTKWTINAPLLSDRSLLGIVMLSFAFQTEYTAGVYVSAIFQSGMTVVIISTLLMKPYPTSRKQLINQQG
jgi:ABC-type multidrug transport system fused ATPase/permease subunit